MCMTCSKTDVLVFQTVEKGREKHKDKTEVSDSPQQPLIKI